MKLDSDLFYYFVYPAVIAFSTVFFTSKATLNHQKRMQLEDERKRALDLIDRFITEISKLLAVLDKLFEEVQRNNYFPFLTIALADPTVMKLNSLVNEVTVFDEDKLRQQIINEVDKVTNLINDIRNVENVPAIGYQDLTKLMREREIEYRSLQIQLLNQGIYYDQSLQRFNYIQKKNKNSRKPIIVDARLQTVQEVLNSLLKDLQSGQQQLEVSQKEAVNRRSFLSLNITVTKQNLKDLVDKLTEKKNTYSSNV